MRTRKDGTLEERFIDKDTGKRVSIYGKTKTEVNRKLTEYKERKEKGILINDGLDMFLAAKEKTVSYKTYEGYQAPAKRIRETFGKEHANMVRPAQIQAFINGYIAKGYKKSTVQRPLDLMRMMYDFLIVTEGTGVKENPAASVKLPKTLKQENRDLAPREAIEIIKANVSHPFGLYPFFQMYSGLRDQELLALTDKDIDRENKTIHVDKALSWQTNKPVIKETKTENGVRSVVLLSPLADVLPNFKGYLFSLNGDGESPLTKSAFRKRWDRYCQDVGLATYEIVKHKSPGKNCRTYEKKVWHNTIVPYVLRHEFATLCFDAGLDPKDTADMMGHSSETTTRKWYTHIQEQRRQSSHSKLENFVTGKTEEDGVKKG